MIFDLASEHSDNSRIVGVFTKCDVTQHPEQVDSVKFSGNTKLANVPRPDRENCHRKPSYSSRTWLVRGSESRPKSVCVV